VPVDGGVFGALTNHATGIASVARLGVDRSLTWQRGALGLDAGDDLVVNPPARREKLSVHLSEPGRGHRNRRRRSGLSHAAGEEIDRPPSTGKTTPVTKPAAGLAR
jgi:hypothetical protein